ncbi:MAG TPA: nucleotide disphospho-sugar-binding domain-containing protein [Desertimonas sp.]|nr:nucleotide disphospho-sugar-binding domain-containing protein [Desertimonas sp.]
MTTFLFMPESAYGPTNNCIGIGTVLRQHGHRVVFAAESSWAGRLEPLGFVEDLVDLAPPPGQADGDAGAGQFWTDFIKETAPEFRRPTIEQLQSFVRPTWQALIDGAKYSHEQLSEIVARHRPDVIIEDNVNCFPALLTAGVPFVRMMSCNPLEMRGPDVPPVFSGYPSDDPSGWQEFRTEYERTHRDLWADYDEWVQSVGAPPLPDLDFIHVSEHLNLYLYPTELDYTAHRPLAPTWHRLDSSVRTTAAAFEVPARLRSSGADHPPDSALVYLSLGSLGSADIDLMRRLVDTLGSTRHRFVVSKGPLADEYELPANMCGAAQVPQTSVLPQVDLVITHGGTNTATESVHFGKPMVVLPLFWDQYDNAQRVDELGFGRRLPTYSFTDNELIDAVDELLADTALRRRVAEVGVAVRARDGVAAAAQRLEQMA